MESFLFLVFFVFIAGRQLFVYCVFAGSAGYGGYFSCQRKVRCWPNIRCRPKKNIFPFFSFKSTPFLNFKSDNHIYVSAHASPMCGAGPIFGAGPENNQFSDIQCWPKKIFFFIFSAGPIFGASPKKNFFSIFLSQIYAIFKF